MVRRPATWVQRLYRGRAGAEGLQGEVGLGWHYWAASQRCKHAMGQGCVEVSAPRRMQGCCVDGQVQGAFNVEQKGHHSVRWRVAAVVAAALPSCWEVSVRLSLCCARLRWSSVV